MKSAQKSVGPICLVFLAAGCGITFFGGWLMASAELVPAQVFPAKRESGESIVRIPSLMQAAAGQAMTIVNTLTSWRAPVKGEDSNNPNPPQIVYPKDYDAWKTELSKNEPEPNYLKNLEGAVGGEVNLKKMVDLVITDPNYPYYAYSLFLALAMFASALAIQAVGRQDSEEVTVLPVKK